MGEHEPELEHPEQDEHERRDEDRELDEGLPARALGMGRSEAGHRTGSMRIALDRAKFQPVPDHICPLLASPIRDRIGVCQVYW